MSLVADRRKSLLGKGEGFNARRRFSSNIIEATFKRVVKDGRWRGQHDGGEQSPGSTKSHQAEADRKGNATVAENALTAF